MLKEYCLWESDKLPKGAIKFKVARPSVLGVPRDLWEEFKNGDLDFTEYSEAYINWAWRHPKARERIKLIAATANRSKKRDVYLGCYCRDFPCHRFALLSFMVDRFHCKADPEALKKAGIVPIRSLGEMIEDFRRQDGRQRGVNCASRGRTIISPATGRRAGVTAGG